VQPLIEHSTSAAGFRTRVLELDALAGTELVLLEGVGHCPQLEATERMADLLLGFQASSSPLDAQPAEPG